MKKLLILAAVLVAGVAANAASFKWTASNAYASDGTTLYNGTATLYAYVATADASTAFAVTTATLVNGAIKSGEGYTVTGLTFDSDLMEVGTTYTAYMVIEDGGKAFTSSTKSVAPNVSTTQTIGFGSLKTATQNTSNWAAVPEPTSGLLMLLGMAGLALRRKRA